MADKLCSTCVFCVQEDYGYSNYTVEGTSLRCCRGLNKPLDGLEQPDSYSKQPVSVESALRFAETCPEYVEGEGPGFDVDGETSAEDYVSHPAYPFLKETPDAR